MKRKLIKEPQVRAAERCQALGEPLRYLAVRLAELMDPFGHFSLSANARFDPGAALRDLVVIAEGFLNNDGTHRETMQDALARTADVIKRDRRLPQWYPTERNAFLQAARAASQPPLTASPSQIKHYVKSRTGALIRGPLQTLMVRIDDPADGYLTRLLGEIEAVVTGPPPNDAGWRSFDESVADFAGIMRAMGRDGTRLALRAAQAFKDADGDRQALDALRTLAHEPQRTFQVAFVLHGTASVTGAEAYDCTIVGRRGARWPRLPDRRAGRSHRSLQEFMERRTNGRHACGVLVGVDALDSEHARSLASATVEQLLDQISAEHRVSSFWLDDAAMVLDVAARKVVSLRTRPDGVTTARTLTRAPESALRESLRYHALAQRETSPVVSVLHSWIAMENLSFNARTTRNNQLVYQGAGSFLPPHLGAVMRLAAARTLLTNTWHVARSRAGDQAADEWRELERWLGVRARGGHVPLDRWTEVLQATPSPNPPDHLDPRAATAEDVSAWLDLLAPDLGIFADRRVRLARWILSDGAILVNYVVAAGQRAETHVGRMNWLRNKAVHNAMTDTPSARQLSRAAYDIADSVYEILPKWLPGRTLPWEALRDIKSHAGRLTTGWRGQTPPQIDTATLIDEP